MELIKSLSFRYIVIMAVVIAAGLSVIPGYLAVLVRRRRKKPAEKPVLSHRPALPVVNAYAAAAENGAEIRTLITDLSSSVSRLDRALISSLELCRRLSGVGGFMREDPGTGPVGTELGRVAGGGADRGDGIVDLDLDSELIELYMHVGRIKQEAVTS